MGTGPKRGDTSHERRGTVDRVGSGRWRVRVRTPDGRRRSALFDTAEEAETFRVGIVAIYAEGTPKTLETFGAQWLDAREVDRVSFR